MANGIIVGVGDFGIAQIKDEAVEAKDIAVSAKDTAVLAKDTAITKASEASSSATSASNSATQAQESEQLAAQHLSEIYELGFQSEYNPTTNTPALSASPNSSLDNGAWYLIASPGTLGFATSNYPSGQSVVIGDKLRKKGSQWVLDRFVIADASVTAAKLDKKYLQEKEFDLYSKLIISSTKGEFNGGSANVGTDTITVPTGQSANNTYLIKSVTNTFIVGETITFCGIFKENIAGSSTNKISFGANKTNAGVNTSNVHQNRVVERLSDTYVKITFDVIVVSGDTKYDVFTQIVGSTNNSGNIWQFVWESLSIKKSSDIFLPSRGSYLLDQITQNKQDIANDKTSIETLMLSDYNGKILEVGNVASISGEFLSGAVSLNNNGITIPSGSTGALSYRFFNFNNYQNVFGKKVGKTLKIYALFEVDSTILFNASAHITRNSVNNTNALTNKKYTYLSANICLYEADLAVLSGDENSSGFKFFYQISNSNPTSTSSRTIKLLDFGINLSGNRTNEFWTIIQEKITSSITDVSMKSEVIASLTGEQLNGGVFSNSNRTITVPIGVTGNSTYLSYNSNVINSNFNSFYNNAKVRFEFLVKITGSLKGSIVAFANGITTIPFAETLQTSGNITYLRVGFDVNVLSSLSAIIPAIQLRNASTVYTETTTFDIVEMSFLVVSNSSQVPSLFSNFKKELVNTIDQEIEKKSTLAKKVIIVRRNGIIGVDCDFSGNRAIQDAIESITDANINNQYIIYVYEGVYEATTVAELNSAFITTGMVSFIRGKNYVSIHGVDKRKCIISMDLPDNLTSSNYQFYQTMYWHSDFGELKGVTVRKRNGRYPIHIDAGRLGAKNYTSNITDCIIEDRGNYGNATAWGSWTPVGLGTSDGQKIILTNCKLISPLIPDYMHNNFAFSNPSHLITINCEYITRDSLKRISTIQSLGSGQKDKRILENCSFSGGYILNANDIPVLPTALNDQNFNHCDIEIQGSGNDPILYNPTFSKSCIRITSKSTGITSKVRFDENSSAYSLIVKDHKYSGSYVNEYGVTEGEYIYRDGYDVLSGYAVSKLDIAEEPVGLPPNALYIKSLGKRLGDCSVVTKTLGIYIDDVLYNVILDKNYNNTSNTTASSYTNQQIINEINAVISSVANIELFSFGNEYYPEFSDCVKNYRSSETILKGMAVVLDSTLLRKATASDVKIYGIALDDITPNFLGRVLIKGYISSDETKRFSTLQETYSAITKGDTLGIATTSGKLSKTAPVKLFRAIDNNVLAINC